MGPTTTTAAAAITTTTTTTAAAATATTTTATTTAATTTTRVWNKMRKCVKFMCQVFIISSVGVSYYKTTLRRHTSFRFLNLRIKI